MSVVSDFFLYSVNLRKLDDKWHATSCLPCVNCR